ncbi:unnamed protein product [Linum trigynum]|uniref:Uncharacterized protein n=1 Tax=Linum trigynum TaxID=586398 RepID=A0AAV2FC06_9ROSI
MPTSDSFRSPTSGRVRTPTSGLVRTLMLDSAPHSDDGETMMPRKRMKMSKESLRKKTKEGNRHWDLRDYAGNVAE